MKRHEDRTRPPYSGCFSEEATRGLYAAAFFARDFRGYVTWLIGADRRPNFEPEVLRPARIGAEHLVLGTFWHVMLTGTGPGPAGEGFSGDPVPLVEELQRAVFRRPWPLFVEPLGFGRIFSDYSPHNVEPAVSASLVCAIGLARIERERQVLPRHVLAGTLLGAAKEVAGLFEIVQRYDPALVARLMALAEVYRSSDVPLKSAFDPNPMKEFVRDFRNDHGRWVPYDGCFEPEAVRCLRESSRVAGKRKRSHIAVEDLTEAVLSSPENREIERLMQTRVPGWSFADLMPVEEEELKRQRIAAHETRTGKKQPIDDDRPPTPHRVGFWKFSSDAYVAIECGILLASANAARTVTPRWLLGGLAMFHKTYARVDETVTHPSYARLKAESLPSRAALQMLEQCPEVFGPPERQTWLWQTHMTPGWTLFLVRGRPRNPWRFLEMLIEFAGLTWDVYWSYPSRRKSSRHLT